MDPRKIVDLRMARLTETLKLDSAQQEKVRFIVAGEIMSLEELHKKSGDDRGESGGRGGGGGRGGRGGGRSGGRHGGGGDATADSTNGGSDRASPEARKIRDSANKEIEAVLNPQQLITYRQLFEQGQAVQRN